MRKRSNACRGEFTIAAIVLLGTLADSRASVQVVLLLSVRERHGTSKAVNESVVLAPYEEKQGECRKRGHRSIRKGARPGCAWMPLDREFGLRDVKLPRNAHVADVRHSVGQKSAL